MKGLLLVAASFATLIVLAIAGRNCVDTDGRVYPEGECAEMVHNCTKGKVCLNGKLYTTDTKCPENSDCLFNVKAGFELCVCRDGYTYNRTKFCWKKSDLYTRPANGGCLFEGRVYPQGKFLSDDCLWNRECKNGLVSSLYTGCDVYNHKTCKTDKAGTKSCACMDGFNHDKQTSQCFNEQNPLTGDCTMPDGQKLQRYHVIFTDNCTKRHTCFNGKIISAIHKCRENERCGQDEEGLMSCVNKKFV